MTAPVQQCQPDIVERLEICASKPFGCNCAAEASARIRELTGVLQEARLQIEYLHRKFQPTGTGEAMMARITSALSLEQGK